MRLNILLVVLILLAIVLAGCVCIGPPASPTVIPEDSDDYPALSNCTVTLNVTESAARYPMTYHYVPGGK